MPHEMTGPAWVVIVGGIVAIVSLLTFAIDRIGKPLRRITRQWEEFGEDWYGKPARPGYRASPGIPERLEKIESAQLSGSDRLAGIEGQLRTNGGSTLRDEIVKIRDRLDEHIRIHSIGLYNQPPNPPEHQ